MQGYSSQAQLFPVAFESGNGVILTDVDGNEYIDFSSGIYVTNWGHCHPKITEAVVEYTRKLQNCHDFNTEIKTRLAEALVQITPGDLNNVQLWCEGSKCVEAALNVARAVTGKHEFISFYNDMHGKTLGAQSLTVMTKVSGPRAAGSFRVPFGNCYHCSFKLKYPACGLHCVEFLREAITELATNDVAAIVVEPIQGWGGSVIPPDDWLPKIRRLCDELGILLICGRGADLHGPDREDVLRRSLERRSGHHDPGKGLRQRISRYGGRLFGQAQGEDERDQGVVQLWRQSDGLRRRPGLRRGRPGRRDARTRRGPRRTSSCEKLKGSRKGTPLSATSAAKDVCWAWNWSKTAKHANRSSRRRTWCTKKPSQRRFLDSSQAEPADVAAADYDQGGGRQGGRSYRGEHRGNRTGTGLRMSG